MEETHERCGHRIGGANAGGKLQRTPQGLWRDNSSEQRRSKAAIKRAGIDPGQVENVIMGNVLQAAQGQNVARQMLIHSGIPQEVPAMTINKVCASGLRPCRSPPR